MSKEICGAEAATGEGKDRVKITCTLSPGHDGPVHLDETSGHSWAPFDEPLPTPENQ